MNQYELMDILKVLRAKKYYKTYSKLRASSYHISKKSKQLLSPTIFELKFSIERKFVLAKFLEKGRTTIFWKANRNEICDSIDEYKTNGSPVSLSYNYKEGLHRIMIFPENTKTRFTSKHLDFGTFDNMVNFIRISSEFTDLFRLFYGCFNVNINLNHLDLSSVTNTSRMFEFAKSFNQPIWDWDVSNVVDMNLMFFVALSFNQSLEYWDVSNVTKMSSMFEDAISFNQPIGDWNVSNVTDMSDMFHRAYSFNQPIGNWDVSNVTDMSYMFNNASSFNQPIGNWNVRSVRSMSFMFKDASSFNQPIGNWNVFSVSSAFGMFDGASLFDFHQAYPMIEVIDRMKSELDYLE